MSIRAKTRRRLVVVLLVAIAVVAASSAFVAVRHGQIKADYEQKRAAGIAAAQAGDHAQALKLLGQYLRRNGDDYEALYHYATARRYVPAEDHSHLAAAADALRRVVEHDPDDRPARDELLELYMQIGRSTEAGAIADQILADQPNDAEALYAKAIVELGLNRNGPALAFAEQLIAAHPEHYKAHQLALQLLHMAGSTPEQIIARAQQFRTDHPGDRRFDVLLAFAQFITGDVTAARTLLATLADWTPDEPWLVRQLARQLAAVELLDQSLALLGQAETKLNDPEIRRDLIRRLWETDRFDALLSRLANLNASDPEADTDLLAYKAMTQYQLGQTQEAAAVIDALAQRQGDPEARAWAAVLQLTASSEPVEPVHAIEVCREALQLHPTNAYAYWVLGQSYAAIGENDMAVICLEGASRLAPMWALPYVRSTQLLLESGRIEQALDTANRAYHLAPLRRQAVNLCVAWAAAIRQGLRDDAEQLLSVTEAIQQTTPGEPQSLVIQAEMLARLNRLDETRAVIQAMLTLDPAPPYAMFTYLAQLSRDAGLGLEDACLQHGRETSAGDPQAVYQQALQLQQRGESEAAIALVDQAIVAQGKQGDLGWRVVRAQVLDAVDAPQAMAAWAALVEEYGDSVHVQRLALQARCLWTDLTLVEATIERLKKLTGDNAIAWRLAKARWLMSGSGSDTDLLAAAAMLDQISRSAPDTVDAWLLLAICHERLGNTARAIEHLTAAVSRQPALTDARLDLARLLIDQGQLDQAARQIEQVVARPNLGPAERERIAALLARIGQVDRAIDLLQSLLADAPNQQNAKLLLANLYRRQNNYEKTHELCRQLLEAPSALVIEFAADFYASVEQPQLADQALAMLDHLELTPGTRELILANHAIRHGEVDTALQLLREAATTAPQTRRIWDQLIVVSVRLGRTEAAIEAIGGAAAALPQVDLYTMLAQHVDLLRQFGDDPSIQPVLAALVEQPARQAEALEVLQQLSQAAAHQINAEDLTATLRQLADRYPRFLALQNMLVRRYLEQNRPDEAARLARRAMQSFPDAVEPAWMAAEALAAAGRWSESLSVAEEWRRRSASQPLAADLLIAEANIQLNDPQSAAARIQPYLERAMADPEANARVIVRHARALIAAGRSDDAAELLRPLLPRGAAWRVTWIQLAVLELADPREVARWLDQVQPAIPADAGNEHVILARAWYDLAKATADAQRQALAKQQIAQWVDDSSATLAAHVNLAEIDDMTGRKQDAEQHYRAALTVDPDLPAANNNLAMILVERGASLDEALQLALAACRSRPDVAAFYDTLAIVQAKRGEYDQAITSREHAVDLDPGAWEWQVRLAELLDNQGQHDRAVQIVDRLRQADPTLKSLSPELRSIVESLSAKEASANL